MLIKSSQHQRCFPCIEPSRCFLTSITTGKRLSSNEKGQVFLSENRKEWEEWLIVIVPDDTTSSRLCLHSVAHGGMLCGDDEGNIITTKTRNEGSCFLLEASSSINNHFQLVCEERNRMMVTVGENICAILRDDDDDDDGACSNGGTLWRCEFISGELCYISNPCLDKRLQCNVTLFGNCTFKMSSSWGGWEVWRLIEAGDGNVIITSWTHHQQVLCSDPDGQVYSTENKLGEWEKWATEKKSDKGVLIRSVTHNRFLSTDGDRLETSLSETSSGCLWSFKPAHHNLFYLSSKSHGKRLGCNQEHSLYTTHDRKKWEEWKIELSRDGLVTVQSHAHGKRRYLAPSPSTDSNHVVMTESEYFWELRDSQLGGVFLTSKDNRRCLVCNSDGTVSLSEYSDSSDKDRTWLLEPRMPHSLRRDQMLAMTVAGVAGASAIIAAPFAVMGAIGALGFTSSGIAAGSIGAGMMSAEAIAAGGGVAAGGTVATLQSIGAAGLGIAGTSSAMGGGALIGGSIIGSTAACVLKSDHANVSADDHCDQDVEDRPFAGWRNWPCIVDHNKEA